MKNKNSKEFYILYLILIPKIRAVKIGITNIDRFDKRFSEIEKAFGSINKYKSIFFISQSMKEIKNFEKSLHLLYWRESKELNQKGSGQTEFFNSKIFEYAHNTIKTLMLSPSIKIQGPYDFLGKKIEKRFNLLDYLTIDKILIILLSISLLVLIYNN